MSLTWKDAIATVLAAGTVTLGTVKYLGWQSWLTAPRLGIITLGAIGIAMCTLSTPTANTPTWTAVLSALGIVGLVLIVVGLITGWSWLYYALAGDILALWILATTKHALT